jgi:hypothetical protein
MEMENQGWNNFQTIVTYGGVSKEWIVEKERRVL